jgi:exodeoxyribonuclease VII large subunit
MQKQVLPLSAITQAISEAIDIFFDSKIITIKAEVTDVKKYPQKKWCFLKFVEKQGANIATEIKGVFWNTGYGSIAKFEAATGQKFTDGLEVICDVLVKYHTRFGLSLEVIDIDIAHSVGQLELERQQTIDRLVKECPGVSIIEGTLYSINKNLPLPTVLKNIALLSPTNADGYRDFIQELQHNKYGYVYHLKEFNVQVQGDKATASMIKALKDILECNKKFDAIAIVRGGGSNTDFKPFDNYELCYLIATSKIPIFTGVGHDRNTSIADMVARQLKTPTKVANYFVEHNFTFEQKIDQLYQRLINAIHQKLNNYKHQLSYLEKTLDNFHPQKILNKGFAMLKQQDIIIEDVSEINAQTPLTIQTKNATIITTINKIDYHA